MKREGIDIEFTMYECEGVPETGRKGKHLVFSILSQLGCRYFNAMPKYLVDSPEKEFRSSIDILPNAGILHPILARSWMSENGTKDGDANISYSADCKLFDLGQRILFKDPLEVEAMARAQLAFLKLLLDRLCPQFTMLDEGGENPISEKTVQKRKLKRLPWCTVWGSDFCESYGKEFFLGAPAARVEDLSCGVLILASDSFIDWLHKPNQKLVEYFGRKFAGIRPFRAKSED